MKKIKIIELFGGIGSATEALKRLGVNVKVVDYVEIDKFAVKSYNAINSEKFEPQDITKWDKDLKCDLIMHGSPCQDFSVAGLNKGGDENSGTRSSLLYESIRIIAKVKPKYVIWENVKNVLSAKHKPNFDKYIQKMSDLGYENYYQVLNAKDYETPQNRERVFCVSILKSENKGFKFPSKKPLKTAYKDLLENSPDDKYFLSDDLAMYFIQHEVEQQKKGNGFKFEVSNNAKIAKAITTNAGNRPHDNFIGDKQNLKNAYLRNFGAMGGLFKGDTTPTLTRAMGSGGGNTPLVKKDFKIRKLTPRECWRLMGFSDVSFDKARAVNSDTQLYKQAGNSIAVNVLMAILDNLLFKEFKKDRLF